MAAPPAAGAFDPRLVPWAPWRPEEVARRLAAVDVAWYVAAGWAIDLFLGSQRREHEDVEIGVPSDRFPELADALAAVELFVVGAGVATPLAEAGELLRTPPDLGARPRGGGLAPRCLSRARRRGHLDLPARPADPPAVRPADRTDGRWDPVRTP